MAAAELIRLMQSVWYQYHVKTCTVHVSVPLIMVVAHVPESSVVVVEAAGGAADTVGATVDAVVVFSAPSEVVDILTETVHGLTRCLSLHAYQVHL